MYMNYESGSVFRYGESWALFFCVSYFDNFT
jgi:hypothetical protein